MKTNQQQNKNKMKQLKAKCWKYSLKLLLFIHANLSTLLKMTIFEEKWEFRDTYSTLKEMEGPYPESLCKPWPCTGRISITIWRVKSVLAYHRQFVFCISVIVILVRIADFCGWNFDFHVSLFHFLWSYF